MEKIDLTQELEIKKSNQERPEIDWELLENSHPRSLVVNTRIQRKLGKDAVVYSHEKNAIDMYQRYFGGTNNLKEPKVGESILGTVTSINNDFAFVDVGWREDAIVDLRKESKQYTQYIRKGYEIEVLIEKTSKDQKNPITASYTKNVLSRRKEELMQAVGEAVAYLGTVTGMIENAGFFVDIDGIKCFMPGSLGGMNKLVNFESLIGKQMYVMPINYSREKDYVVVSHRDYLKTLVPEELKKLEVGKLYEGFVTGASKHGIFVEFNGCLTGLIAIKDIAPEFMNKFESRGYRPGESVSFYVKEIVDNNKIVLSQIPVAPSAWNGIEERYEIPSVVTGKIKKISKFGLFVEIEPRVVGLLRKSYLDENDVFEVGQEIEVQITKIDKEEKKIDFAL